jgi:hypothetical protein
MSAELWWLKNFVNEVKIDPQLLPTFEGINVSHGCTQITQFEVWL